MRLGRGEGLRCKRRAKTHRNPPRRKKPPLPGKGKAAAEKAGLQVHHAALHADTVLQRGGDKGLEQRVSTVGTALEFGMILYSYIEIVFRNLYSLDYSVIG